MTTSDQACTAIFDRWITQWGTTTPFKFMGETTKLEEGAVPYVILGVVHEPRQRDGQITLGAIGNRKFDRQGRIELLLSTLAKDGRSPLDGLQHTARGIFEARRFSGVQCYDGEFRETGIDGKWHTGRVDILFSYQEIK